jgi:hypothetical protein
VSEPPVSPPGPSTFVHEPPPSERCAPFSLFDDDLLNRIFASIGLQSRHGRDLAGRIAAVVCLTWMPMAMFALMEGLVSTRIEATNFFADYAAYAQFLIALPLYIIAERVVNRNTREGSRDFLDTGVVDPADVPYVNESHLEVKRLRLAWWPEALCIFLAYFFALSTILPEFFGADLLTWHTQLFGHQRHLTWAGGWAMLVALPVYNYWWLRIAWKVAIWTRYLWRMSRLHLQLVASHPDEMGGIGFVGEVQAKFAIVIFAYGISSVAAVVAYKVKIEGASLLVPPVWGTTLGFILGAPAAFLWPLFMFTKQLFRTKRKMVALYREQATRHARAFEAKWIGLHAHDDSVIDVQELMRINHVATVFERIEHMRVVPFDLRSAMQLIGSTLGSVATALPLMKIEGPLKEWLDLLSRLFGHGGG